MKKLQSINRRKFLRTSSAFTAGMLVIPSFSCSSDKKKTGKTTSDMKKIIGLQLYSVRTEIEKIGLEAALEKLAKIGFNSVEAAGYDLEQRTFYGLSPKEFGEKVKSFNMALNSSHTMFEPEKAKQVFADAAEAGSKYVIFPWLPEERRKSMDSYKKLTEGLNKSGEVAKSYNIRFGYHNHDFELLEVDGEIPYNYMLENTQPEWVCFEMDLYWITYAKADPVAYFEKYPGRFELLHVKDMVKTEDRFFSPVGLGRIDFARIFTKKETAGMKYFFVEQDNFKKYEPFVSVELSHKFLRKADFV